MLNAADADRTETAPPPLLEGIAFGEAGRINVSEETILEHIRQAVRLPYPQVRPQPPTYDRVALVGGGPSLADTIGELRDLYYEGAQVVTVNGAYGWCIEHNLMPKMQVVLDARLVNARFLVPAVPRCRYVLASQCHPETWRAVAGRPDVWMFHAVVGRDTPERALLDAYYAGQWYGVGGGTTVMTRAISLLRMLGYLRFDLFGVDCCWLGDRHHAYAQPENDGDHRLRITAAPPGAARGREFVVAPWHLKQLDDMLQMMRMNGRHFKLAVHGDGLLAYVLREHASVEASAALAAGAAEA